MRLKLLFLFAVLATAINVSAYDFKVDGIYYNILSQEDLTCEVTRGDTKYYNDIVIPSSVTYNEQTYAVTAIGDNAFLYCTSLKSVEVPNSVTYIGSNAFQYCIQLTSFVIPNSVTMLGWGTFQNCSRLTSVVIPNSLDMIVYGAFWGCSALESVEIPSSVTSIGGYAFYYCTSLTSVTIPNSVTSIGDFTFENCSALTSVEIGNSVAEIGYHAFSSCSALTEITSLAVTPPTIATDGNYPDTFEGVSKEECVLKVPEGSVEAYKTANNWKDFLNIKGIKATGIATPFVNGFRTGGKAYNMNGTEANDGYRGIVIKNGKKVLRK